MIKKVKYILFFIGLSCNLWSEIIVDNPKDLYDVELSIYDGPSSLLLDWRMSGDILPKKIKIFRTNTPSSGRGSARRKGFKYCENRFSFQSC